MNTLKLVDDSRFRPELFNLNGPISEPDLSQWLSSRSLAGSIPLDLIELWKQTGGGEILESETLLSPFGRAALGDDIDSVNAELHRQGLPNQFLVFHVGVRTSAVDLQTGRYLDVHPAAFKVLASFETLDDWYLTTIRKELGGRYGLRADDAGSTAPRS